MFGRLSGHVRRCVRRRRPAQVLIYGGPGSGKTYGGLHLAMGLRTGDGVVVVLSADENLSEEHYAHLGEFHHVDLLALREVADAVVRDKVLRRMLPIATEGVDPRVVRAVIDELGEHLPDGSVVVLDTLTAAWDATKSLAEGAGGEWQAPTVCWTALLRSIDSMRVHMVVLARAKTQTDVDKVDGKLIRWQTPTEPDLKRKDCHRLDLRIGLDSRHDVVIVEGRCTQLNESPPLRLSVEVGQQLRAYLEGDDGIVEQTGQMTQSQAAVSYGDVASEVGEDEPVQDRALPTRQTRPMSWGEFCECCELVDIEPAEIELYMSKVWGRPAGLDASNRALSRHALAYALHLPAFRRMVRALAIEDSVPLQAEPVLTFADEVDAVAPGNSVVGDLRELAVEPGERLLKAIREGAMLLDEARLLKQAGGGEAALLGDGLTGGDR